MKRELFIIIGLSLMSAFAGIMLYRYFFFQPAFVSAAQSTTRTDSGNQATSALTFDRIVLPDVNQHPQALSQWNHKPLLLVNFWAPWCAPCRREIPALIELQHEYSDQLQLVGLSFDSLENVRDFSSQYRFNYPLLLVDQQAQPLNKYFGNNSGGLPFSVILNAKREIIYSHSGEIDKSQLVAIIEPQLAN